MEDKEDHEFKLAESQTIIHNLNKQIEQMRIKIADLEKGKSLKLGKSFAYDEKSIASHSIINNSYMNQSLNNSLANISCTTEAAYLMLE